MKWQIPSGRSLQPTNDNNQDSSAEKGLIAFCEEHFPSRAEAQARIVSQAIALEASRQQLREVLGSTAHIFAWVRPILLFALLASSIMVALAARANTETMPFVAEILVASISLWLLLEQFEKALGRFVLKGWNPINVQSWRFETAPKMRRKYKEAYGKVRDKRVKALC